MAAGSLSLRGVTIKDSTGAGVRGGSSVTVADSTFSGNFNGLTEVKGDSTLTNSTVTQSVSHGIKTDAGTRWKVPQGGGNGIGGFRYVDDRPDSYRNVFNIKSKDQPAAWAVSRANHRSGAWLK